MSTTREFPAFAWPGGYPIIYIDPDGETLCAECARADASENGMGFESEIYWEGMDTHCAECSKAIESAYGDPDASESEAVLASA